MDNASTVTPAVDRLVAHLGGPTAAAGAFGVKPPSISEWLQRGKLPAGRCLAAEQLTGGAFTRYELRPDIFGAAASAEAA